MIQYIVVSGAPNSGKTTAVRWLTKMLSMEGSTYPCVVQDDFDMPVKHFLATLVGGRYHDMDKVKPRAELQGRSVNDFVEDVIKDYIKTHYGEDFLGRMLVFRSLRHIPALDYVLIEASAGSVELDALPNKCIIEITGEVPNIVKRGSMTAPVIIVSNKGGMDVFYGRVAHTAAIIRGKEALT